MSTALSATQLAPSCTEHDLVAAVRRGSDPAFEELYSRYRAPIGSYVLRLVGDHGRAEDIAQEVFISALRRLRDTERPIAFRPWIYEIAKNACIDEFRRTRRTREVPLDPEDDAEGGSRGLHSLAPTPEAAVESRQSLHDLCGAFRGLSASHHRILVLRELEGLSYEQIGARMGISRAAVESTLFRARRRLGGEYDELVSGRRCERVQTVLAAGGDRSLRSLGIRERASSPGISPIASPAGARRGWPASTTHSSGSRAWPAGSPPCCRSPGCPGAPGAPLAPRAARPLAPVARPRRQGCARGFRLPSDCGGSVAAYRRAVRGPDRSRLRVRTGRRRGRRAGDRGGRIGDAGGWSRRTPCVRRWLCSAGAGGWRRTRELGEQGRVH